MLSGYLMGKAFYGGRYRLDYLGIAQFYTNRLLRIAPLYWAAILTVAAVERPASLRFENIPGFISSLFFFQQIELGSTVIGALWSVQTEVGFYLVAPFLFVLLARFIHSARDATIIAMAAIAIGVGYRAAVLLTAGGVHWNDMIMAPTLANLDLFLTGMLTNWIVRDIRTLERFGYVAAAALATTLYIVTSLWFSRAEFEHLHKGYFITFAPSAVAIVIVAALVFLERARIHQTTIIRLSQWFGILTYAVYVVHEPVYKLVGALAPSTVYASQSFAFTIIAIIASILIATAAYLFIERPFDVLKLRS